MGGGGSCLLQLIPPASNPTDTPPPPTHTHTGAGGIRWGQETGNDLTPAPVLGPVHKQSNVNYNELELHLKSISSNFIGSICFHAHSYLTRLCL